MSCVLNLTLINMLSMNYEVIWMLNLKYEGITAV